MKKLRQIAALLLTLSLLISGLPVQAKVMTCPMMATMQKQQAEMKRPCEHCPQMTEKQEQQKKKCADDPACAAKCFAMNGMSSALLPTQTTERSFAHTTQRYFGHNTLLASFGQKTQDRPPKNLS